jgi:hypothetical protein
VFSFVGENRVYYGESKEHAVAFAGSSGRDVVRTRRKVSRAGWMVGPEELKSALS